MFRGFDLAQPTSNENAGDHDNDRVNGEHDGAMVAVKLGGRENDRQRRHNKGDDDRALRFGFASHWESLSGFAHKPHGAHYGWMPA
jgi:hypothetical protein